MRAEIVTYEGKCYQLPDLLAWKMEYACGTPCDSFWIQAVWQPGEEEIYRKAVELRAWQDDERVFTGRIDEVEWTRDQRGSRVELAGRSMAALLLDNEAEAADYAAATLEDILRDHVTPYGIEVGERSTVPACQNFTVTAGSSEWQVLYEFVRYHGGLQPRFDREGRLLLTPLEENRERILDSTTALTALTGREKRYGVLSEVVVRDKRRQRAERVVNEDFVRQGGKARRLLTMSGTPAERAMRYNGQFQLKKAQAEQRRLEVTMPTLFPAWPGELLRVNREEESTNGLWRVLEMTVEEGTRGGSTTLVLGAPDAIF